MKELKIAPGYSITKDGFVVNNTGKKTNGYPDRYGYRSVKLTINGKKINFSIRKLVASEFLNEKVYNNKGMTLRHIDGDNGNNHYKNLIWVPDADRSKSPILIKELDIREGDFVNNSMVDSWLVNGDAKSIVGFDNYYIHNKGFVIVKKTNRISKTFLGNRGYRRVGLINNRRTKKFVIHILVAKHFLKEQKSYIPGMIIRHIDNNKFNNDYNNLRWEYDIKRSTRKVIIEELDLRESDFVSNGTINKWLTNGDIRTINNNPEYYVHRLGFIISKRYKRIMSTFKVGEYYAVNIYSKQHCKMQSLRIHRLVAESFIDGRSVTNNVVNHKDGIQINNRWDNLEWTNAEGNMQHAIRTGLTNFNNKVLLKDVKNNSEQSLLSLTDTSRTIGISNNALLPRIKYSYEYPIFNRYVVKLIDEKKFIGNKKNKNTLFTFYIYDHISDTKVKLDTYNKVIYYTSIFINDIKKIVKTGYGYFAGFSVGVNSWYIKKTVTKELAINDRKKYNKNKDFSK